MPFAEIAVDAPVRPDATFSYSIPAGLDLAAGHSVWVPFGARRLQGIVFSLAEKPAVEQVREVLGLVDPDPILDSEQLDLARWISNRYLCSLFEACSVMLPQGFRRRVKTYYSPTGKPPPPDFQPTETEEKALRILAESGRITPTALRKQLRLRSLTGVDRLERLGLVLRESEWPRPKVNPKYETRYSLAVDPDEAIEKAALKKTAVQQRALLEALLDSPDGLSTAELRERGISPSAVKTLQGWGVVESQKVRVIRDPLASRHYETSPPPDLTPDQARAWGPIQHALEQVEPCQPGRAFLLRGVTGSGKTELYLRALQRTLELGKRGIVLVPEISLTPQTVQRFSARFPGQVAVLHSRLKPGERFDEWWRIRKGEFGVVIGSRSALFSPQPDLGLIVLDEEHDSSYKQSEPAPRYHAPRRRAGDGPEVGGGGDPGQRHPGRYDLPSGVHRRA